ncbi:PREDICTED: shematrin-like protein 1 [Habropoda laboriosa]|uniref:shematrin-like protein 1 n=1 Tax=Habropoda laboriosa TaxID=597456 RepID=UPI00083E4CFC|nr:PREDICTED: shematrin-like protein 1 [Habropoda laboriosa]
MACLKLYTVLLLAVIVGIVSARPGFLGGYGYGTYYPFHYGIRYPIYGYGHGFGHYGYPSYGYGHGYGHYGGYY